MTILYGDVMAERPPPLIRLLSIAAQQLEEAVLRRQHAGGFTDIRPAHGAVFAHVPPEGIRLTDLAKRAGMSKQAMSELVLDMEALGYLERTPDPDDGRSRLIGFTKRGWAAIDNALDAFDDMEAELGARIGVTRVAELRRTLERMLANPPS